MSCQLNLLSKIKDAATLKKFINPVIAETDETNKSDADGWNNDWGWDEETDGRLVAGGGDSTDDSLTKDDWLSECEVSISALGDLIVVAKIDRLAVIQISYEKDDEGMFVIIWKGIVTEFPRESVTCVYCLPLISYKRSSQGEPEWSCIIVGFNTGHIRMYNETGTKVLDQMIHNESVMCIKCKTYSPPRYPASSDLTEELTILYETVLVSLDGLSLFQTLRACKNRAAMAAARGSPELELPPLGYKKWGLKGQGLASEPISGGYHTPNVFDQMQTASLAGFKERISAVPPTSHVYACTGDNPFIGVYHAMDGESYQLFNNVTEVATKLLSVGAAKLFSWGSSFLKKPDPAPETEKKQHKLESATPVFRRYSLYDKRRIGQSMSLSPAGNIAAVTDSLGRVLLVDTHRGVIKRIWKGYRQAQIGWMTVKERSSSRQAYRRHAFFLVIYAPKRGLLEIWLSDGGPRVGAFNVGKGCRLIYPGCSLLGVNSSTYKLVKGKICQCFLLKPSGELVNITIPFHLALSDANSRRAHDQQLMTLVKSALRDDVSDLDKLADDLWQPISKMKLTISLQIALEKVLSTSHVTSVTALAVIDKVSELVIRRNPQKQAPEQPESEETAGADKSMNVESRLLLELCASRKLLVDIHSKLRSWLDMECEEKVVDLSTLRPLDEVATLLMLRAPSHLEKKVGFSSDSQLNLCDFLALCESQHGHQSTIKLRQLSDSQMVSLGQIIFGACLKNSIDFNDIRELMSPLDLAPRSLLDILLRYYLSLQSPSNAYLNSLESIISILYNLDKEQESTSTTEEIVNVEPQGPTTPEYDGLSPVLKYDQEMPPFPQSKTPWWIHIRDACEASTNLLSYLHLAIVCRSICIRETEQLSSEFGESSDPLEDFDKAPTTTVAPESSKADSSWEHFSVEVAMWNMSFKHLEDVIILNTLLRHKLNDSTRGSKTVLNIVSVKEVKTGNRGFVGELVGRWCVCNLLSPVDLIKYETMSAPTSPEKNETAAEELADPYVKLKETFPVSLSSDIIYANACWEFMSQWNKDYECLYNLKFALDYLLNIENSCLKHGISVMIWRTYLLKKIASLVSLIGKVGKVPKDRLCKKEIEMDTATTTEFMTAVCDYMEIFLQANCDFSEPVLCRQESIWSEETTGHSLVQMACQQRETNYRLLQHHSLLIRVITAVLVFNMKSVKPMSLFDHNGNVAFFKDLHSHPYLGVEGKDEIVSTNRKEFLCRVLRHTVESLPDRASMVGPGGLVRIEKDSDAMKWPVIVMNLAELFDLESDYLRKFYISVLASHGYDALALEVVPFMSDPVPAYNELLDVCAQRFSYLMFQADQAKLTEITSAATPSLINWLQEKYYSDLATLDVQLSDTTSLLMRILNGLQPSSKYHRYAEELYKLTADMTGC